MTYLSVQWTPYHRAFTVHKVTVIEKISNMRDFCYLQFTNPSLSVFKVSSSTRFSQYLKRYCTSEGHTANACKHETQVFQRFRSYFSDHKLFQGISCNGGDTVSQILCSVPLILICANYQDINEHWHHSQEHEGKNLVTTLLQ